MSDGLRYCQHSNVLKFILTYTVATFFENNFFFFKRALLKKRIHCNLYNLIKKEDIKKKTI